MPNYCFASYSQKNEPFLPHTQKKKNPKSCHTLYASCDILQHEVASQTVLDSIVL